MARSPILTVVLLTYNHEDTIAAALDSVLSQKTSYPYVVWIAEDCSTDNTLNICREYVRQYPARVRLFAQPKNTNSAHLREILSAIDTKYLTILEGDDCWCDKEKVQIALDTLESKPGYVTFAHDTLYNDIVNKTQKSLVHDIHKIKIKNPVSLYEAPYLHTSARVHRNVVDIKEHFKTLKRVGDIYMFYAYLDKGPLYYHDKIMSVYNITNKGTWTMLSKKEQVKNTELSCYRGNILLGYRHDAFFSERVSNVEALKYCKTIFGVKLGWLVYTFLIRRLVK
jgi:glycosyltransferase involved in cell wall biosynthesis